MFSFRSIILIVLDSAGIGAAPDASDYGDEGCDTLGHLAGYRQMKIPNLAALGIGNIRNLQKIPGSDFPIGCYGKMKEISRGKGSTEGHWEIAGCPTLEPFDLFPNGFPPEVVNRFTSAIGRSILGNIPASGTEIINRLGDEHRRSGFPILYTSADSVFQLAADEEIVPLRTLYEWCMTAREMFRKKPKILRIIARPFVKEGDNYIRTRNRRDFSLEPHLPTMLDRLKAGGFEVTGIGKIEDLFAARGLTSAIHTRSNDHSMEETIKIAGNIKEGLVFTNLIDFDMVYGHRNDPDGYIDALERFDLQLGELLDFLGRDQLLMISADHGCDPLFKGWDHTREYVPLLVFSPSFKTGRGLGTRETFADISATVLDNFHLEPLEYGNSFLNDII